MSDYKYYSNQTWLRLNSSSNNLLCVSFLVVVFGLSLPSVTSASDIHRAAREGDLVGVRTLLETNRDSVEEITNDDHSTPLHEAVRGGHLEIARLLIAARADVNAKTTLGLTPLKLARGYGKMELADFLESNGAQLLEPPVELRPWIPVSTQIAPAASLPTYQRTLRGDSELRIINNSRTSVTVRIISGGAGAELRIISGRSKSAWVPPGNYRIYYVFSDDPGSLYEGDPVRISWNTASSTIQLGAAVGNYRIRRVN